jgi:zinc D-Ala-D-Ala carboxypeptidase
MATQLTPHFALEEFTASQTAARQGLNNQPDEPALANLKRTAELMEKVRVVLGNRPVLISSGYRSPQVNAAVGGSSSSAHMSGLAVDFTCPGFGTPRDICRALSPRMGELEIDQLILEHDGWCHLGLTVGAPRCQLATIDSGGFRLGLA